MMNTVNKMPHHVGMVWPCESLQDCFVNSWFNLSVNGYVLESVLGYNFEHNKQLAFGWLFIIAPTPYWRVPIRTKQLSTVKVAGLVRALTHIVSLTNQFQRNFPATHFILLIFYIWRSHVCNMSTKWSPCYLRCVPAYVNVCCRHAVATLGEEAVPPQLLSQILWLLLLHRKS